MTGNDLKFCVCNNFSDVKYCIETPSDNATSPFPSSDMHRIACASCNGNMYYVSWKQCHVGKSMSWKACQPYQVSHIRTRGPGGGGDLVPTMPGCVCQR